MKNEKYIIYLLTNTLLSGGAEKQSVFLFKALRSRYRVFLVVYYGDQVDQRIFSLLSEDSLSDVILLKGNHVNRLRDINKAFSISKNSVCISYLATSNTINAIVGKISGIKFRIGGFRSSHFSYFKLLIQRKLHNSFLSHSISNNYLGLAYLVKFGFDPNKLSVIHNAIEIPENRKRDHEILTIISVGRFVLAKDYFTAINAIGFLNQSKHKFKYIIVGYGKLEPTIRSYIIAAKLESVIELIINPTSIDPYYVTSDIYLSTSIYEGLSNSIMEAMSFGLPVVATDVGDTKYLVKDSETGFLVQIKDDKNIASKLELLIQNEDLRLEIGNKARKHIIDNFSIEKFTQQYLDLIEKLSNE